MASKKQNTGKSDKRVFYLFAYVLAFLSGIAVYVTEGQRNSRAKFHALQAILLGIVIFILAYIPYINILALILWLYGLYIGLRAYEGTDVEIPGLGEYARKYS